MEAVVEKQVVLVMSVEEARALHDEAYLCQNPTRQTSSIDGPLRRLVDCLTAAAVQTA